MSLQSPSHLLSCATFQPMTYITSFPIQPPSLRFKVVEKNSRYSIVKPLCASQKTVSAQLSDDHWRRKLHRFADRARNLWDNSPEPVKKFPWNKALDNLIQLVLDITLAVVKYLSVPLFTVTSLGELSYCARENKVALIPLSVLFGVAVAGILKDTALELSPLLRDAEVPWHLIAIAVFFTLIKLPGPYYPYWGRIIIPHFANGALLRTVWFAILWFRRPKALKMSGSIGDS